MSISQLSSVRFPVKVWVMANNLREICVCGAAQRMWEDKVHQDAFGIRDRVGLKTFCIMDSFGSVGVRYRVGSKSSCKLHRRFWEIRANVFVVETKGKSGTKTGGKLAKSRKECSEYGKAGLSALLCFIIDSKTAKNEKGGKEWMGGRGITED